MKKCLIPVVAAMTLSINLGYAADVSVSQAAAAAQAWIDEGSSMGKLTGAVVEKAEIAVDDATGVKMHVVSLQDGGFVVTASDDLLDPVLAFSDSGRTLIQSDKNPIWVLLKGDIAARMAAATNGASHSLQSLAGRTESQKRWDALLARASGKATMGIGSSTISDIRVDSFVNSRWGQDKVSGKNVFNYYTPNSYVCGCVATMAGQMMRYWQWPQSSVAAKTHQCSVDGTKKNYTMKGGTYAWSSMPLVPGSSITDVQRQAIGKLTYDIGVSVGMAWSKGGSGSSTFAAQLRMVDSFGYANGASAAFTSSWAYNLDRVKSIVIPNCDARAPLGMSIDGSTSGGHAVVVDGYGYSGNDFYMHVNCGWDGLDDAWYCPPAITTSQYKFETIDGFIFNIFPQKKGSIVSGRVLSSAKVGIANATVQLKQNSAVVATTTTDDKGIYSFIVEPGAYVVSAASGSNKAELGVTAVQTVGTKLVEGGYGEYYTSPNPTIGNQYNKDITLSSVAQVPAPTFTPAPGLFYPSTKVTISCAESGVTIRYTTNGSDPTTSSTKYTGAISISDTTTIKARAWKSGKNPSAIVAATYTYDASAGAPKGDYFDNPIEISGQSGSKKIEDNTNYTIETDEPLHTLENGSYYSQYRSAWLKWTAPGTGTETFKLMHRSLEGNTLYSLPAYIAVYTGDSLTSITRIGMDYDADKNYESVLSVSVTQGKVYRIVLVSGYKDLTGYYEFSWSGSLKVTPTATSKSEVSVPYTWLDQYYPKQGTSEAAYETLATKDTDGDGFTAWEEYAANTDPTDAESKLYCEISLKADGTPVITEYPAWPRDGFPRTLQGSNNLTSWTDLTSPSKSYKFYRLNVSTGK